MYSPKRVVVSSFGLLAFLISTYGGIFLPVPTAWAAEPVVKITLVNVKRVASDDRPLGVCAKTTSDQPVAGVLITATLTVFAGRPKELTTGADGCAYLGLDLPTTAGHYNFGSLVLKEDSTVTAELVVEITTTLLAKGGVEIIPPANAKSVFPAGLQGLSEREVRDYLWQAGWGQASPDQIKANYYPCSALAGGENQRYCQERIPLGGLLSATVQNPTNAWNESVALDLNQNSRPLPGGWTLLLAFRFPGGAASEARVVPATVEVISTTVRTLPLNLYNHPENEVRRVLAPVLAGAKIDVAVQYQPVKPANTNPGGLVSLMLVDKLGRAAMVDLSKEVRIPDGTVKIVLGFRMKEGKPTAPPITPKPIVAKPALPGEGKVKFPAGMYSHSSKDVEVALAKAGLRVGHVANQRLSQVGDDANMVRYFQQTQKGGLLSASYVNTQGQRVFFDLFNPEAPQNQVAPGTVIDLAFRSP